MITLAPPICPKSALSPLPLIRRLMPLPTTRIRDEKLYAFAEPGHHPTPGDNARVSLSGGTREGIAPMPSAASFGCLLQRLHQAICRLMGVVGGPDWIGLPCLQERNSL